MTYEPAAIEDLWHPGSPRPPCQYTLDGICLLCAELVPNTRNTLTPIGLVCIRCQLDRLPPRPNWRQRANERARAIFQGFGLDP